MDDKALQVSLYNTFYALLIIHFDSVILQDACSPHYSIFELATSRFQTR
jgi:hypothetical protein